MTFSEVAKTGLLPGALAGLLGGLIFGVTMSELDRMPEFGELLRSDSSVAGFVVAIAVGSILGAGYGLLVCYQRPGAGETLFWGLVYGVFWWYLGSLTLQPLLEGDGLTWDVLSAQSEFPVLLGLILYGACTGLALLLFRWKSQARAHLMDVTTGALVRGMLAGLFAASILAAALNSQGELLTFASMTSNDPEIAAWFITLLIGLVAGLGYALLYPNPIDGTGTGLIRGTAYGFFWWVVGGLTVVPLISGAGLTWSLDDVRLVSAILPGYVLFGAAVVLFYRWLGSLVSLLFSDDFGSRAEEGVGTQGLRIIGRSVLAGLAGGLVFSLVMFQIDFLPNVADLVGSTSPVAGFFVHLVIATLVGMSYGLLFRQHSYDIGSALGWGVSYGFFWSILGPLTLMPIFLGSSPQWTIEAVAAAFPNLIGHLAYGAGLGIMFYFLEARYRPWWVTRTQAGADRVAHRKEQVLTSAPALWTLLVALGLTLPVILAP